MRGASKHALELDRQRHGDVTPVYFHVPTAQARDVERLSDVTAWWVQRISTWGDSAAGDIWPCRETLLLALVGASEWGPEMLWISCSPQHSSPWPGTAWPRCQQCRWVDAVAYGKGALFKGLEDVEAGVKQECGAREGNGGR